MPCYPNYVAQDVSQGVGLDSALFHRFDCQDVVAFFENAIYANDSERYVDYDPNGSLNTGLIGPFPGGTPAIIVVNGRRFVQIEEARTNLAWYSEDFDNWGTVASDWDDTAHFGDAMRRLQEQAITNGHRSFRDNITTDGSSKYCWSNYARASERTKVATSWGGTGFPGSGASRYNLSDGSLIDTGADYADIYSVKNSVYRMWNTYTSNAANPVDQSLYLLDAGGNFSYLGDGTSGAYFYGAQCEIANYPSSYIHTPTNATVTRARDQLYWEEADVPAALRQRITFQFIPGWDSDVRTADCTMVYYVASGASSQYTYKYNAAADKFEVRTTGGSLVFASDAVSFSARNTITFTFDPQLGEMIISGCDTGDGTYSGTPWSTSAGRVWWGTGTTAAQTIDGLISDPY